jgi:hypothetical protein
MVGCDAAPNRTKASKRPIMKSPMNTLPLCASIALLSLGFSAAHAQNTPNAPESMRFFVTSAGSGKGGGAAMLGHSDRTGLTDNPPGRSWNSSHPSRDCSQNGLKSTGGAGLFYCFATN